MKKVSDYDLVKKFNRVLKTVTKNNLSTVKDELLEILEEYKSVKCEEFIESKNLLTQSIKLVETQKASIVKQEQSILNELKKIKGSSDEKSLTIGAMYIHELEKVRDIKSKLDTTMNQLKEKIDLVSNNIEMFNHHYSIKKSEITIMIAGATVLNGVSDIDKRLNKLVIDFNNLTTENDIRSEVTSKIYGEESLLEKSDIEFNKEVYVEKFKNFSE